MSNRIRTRSIPRLSWLLLLLFSLGIAACNPVSDPPPGTATTQPTATEEVTTASPVATLKSEPSTQSAATSADGTPVARRCETGRLAIADLPSLDRLWREIVSEATEAARNWQDDARLTSAAISCEYFGESIRWQLTFYSPGDHSFFDSLTRTAEPAPDSATGLGVIDSAAVSFTDVAEALIAEGYSDTTLLLPSNGLDVGTSTDELPFGPPEAPIGATYVHVAIEEFGQVVDLFVSVRDGVIYRYLP